MNNHKDFNVNGWKTWNISYDMIHLLQITKTSHPKEEDASVHVVVQSRGVGILKSVR